MDFRAASRPAGGSAVCARTTALRNSGWSGRYMFDVSYLQHYLNINSARHIPPDVQKLSLSLSLSLSLKSHKRT